jgi:SAM-dependent methyltransferase
MTALQAKWDAIYSQQVAEFQVAEVLTNHLFLLPKQGKALDLACGLGGNALLLAKLGLHVDAWDISAVALQLLQAEAVNRQLNLTLQQGIICPEILPVAQYDVIVISRFLDRGLCNAIMGALKAGGLLYYQTFTRSKLDAQGPSNPEFLLATNELLHLFSPLTLLFYQEFAQIGNVQIGDRNMAYLVGQKSF